MGAPHNYPETTYIDNTAIIDPDVQIGKQSSIWHYCHIMTGAIIGEQCHLGQNVVMQPQTKIGNRCRILNNVTLYRGVECQDDVFLGPSCVFTNVINPRAFINRKEEIRPTRVLRGATIGANATILCGIEIGSYALVGAGSVVTQSIPNYALVVGNPAQQIGWVSREGYTLQFDSEGVAHCGEEGGKVYRLDSEKRIVREE